MKNFKAVAFQALLLIGLAFTACRSSQRHAAPVLNAALVTTDLSTWKGQYRISVEGEATTTGMSSTTWTITITPQQVEVKISTYHEPILCDGIYRGQEEQGMLQLFYSGEDTSCRHETPNFTIKKEHGEYYIRGPFGEANYDTWMELDKINP